MLNSMGYLTVGIVAGKCLDITLNLLSNPMFLHPKKPHIIHNVPMAGKADRVMVSHYKVRLIRLLQGRWPCSRQLIG